MKRPLKKQVYFSFLDIFLSLERLTSIKTNTWKASNFPYVLCCLLGESRRKRHFWANVSHTLTIWGGAKSSRSPYILLMDAPRVRRLYDLLLSCCLPLCWFLLCARPLGYPSHFPPARVHVAGTHRWVCISIQAGCTWIPRTTEQRNPRVSDTFAKIHLLGHSFEIIPNPLTSYEGTFRVRERTLRKRLVTLRIFPVLHTS